MLIPLLLPSYFKDIKIRQNLCSSLAWSQVDHSHSRVRSPGHCHLSGHPKWRPVSLHLACRIKDIHWRGIENEIKMAGRLWYVDVVPTIRYVAASVKLCVLWFLFLNVSDTVSLSARCWECLMRAEWVILLVLLFLFCWCFCITNHIQASYCSPCSFLPVHAYI